MSETQPTTPKDALDRAYLELIDINNLAQTLLSAVKGRDIEGEYQPDQYVIELLVKSIADLTEKISQQV